MIIDKIRGIFKDNCFILSVVMVCMYFGLLCYGLACFSVMTEQTMKREDDKEFADRMLEFEQRIEAKVDTHTHRYFDGKVK